MGARGKINIDISTADSDAMDLGGALIKNAIKLIKALPNGTASGEIDEAWGDAGSVAAAANTDLDLTSLPAATGDPRGAGVSIGVLKLIVVKKTDSGDYMQLFASGANDIAGVDDYPLADATDKAQVVGENGLYIYYNPEGCTIDGTHKILRIAGVTSTQEYEILLAGEA